MHRTAATGSRSRCVVVVWFLCKAMSVLRQTRRPRSLSSPLPALLMVCGERSVSVRIRILESLFSFSTLHQIGHASLFCERSKQLGVKARCADSLGQDVEIICVGPPHTASRLGGRWTRVVRGCCELANAFEQPVFGPSGRGRVCVFFYRQFPPGGERAESICGCARHRNRFWSRPAAACVLRACLVALSCAAVRITVGYCRLLAVGDGLGNHCLINSQRHKFYALSLPFSDGRHYTTIAVHSWSRATVICVSIPMSGRFSAFIFHVKGQLSIAHIMHELQHKR